MKSRKIALAMAAGLFALVSAYAADVTGKWKAEFDTPIGVQKYTYDLKVDGSKVTGKAISERGETEIIDGKLDGATISFTEKLSFEGQELKIDYTGKIDGDEIKFHRQVGDFGSEDFVAKRQK